MALPSPGGQDRPAALPALGVQEAADAIRSMRVRGAAAIGATAAQALARHVQSLGGSPAAVLEGARRAARMLDAARPTAVTLHNGLGWVLAAVAGAGTAAGQRTAALEAARRVVDGVAASRAAIAAHGARLVPDGGAVLTHCNSSTSLAVLKAAHAAGRSFEVVATETRPFGQGLLTVRELHAAGIRCSLVVDSAVEHVLSTRDVALVLVGADTVASDGSLFNKIGTAGAAALAHLHGVPFHAAAGLHKFTRRGPDEVAVEERDPAEVVPPRDVPPGVRVLNPVFDRTPPARVTSYVTEEGPAKPARAVRRALPLLPPEEAWG